MKKKVAITRFPYAYCQIVNGSSATTQLIEPGEPKRGSAKAGRPARKRALEKEEESPSGNDDEAATSN